MIEFRQIQVDVTHYSFTLLWQTVSMQIILRSRAFLFWSLQSMDDSFNIRDTKIILHRLNAQHISNTQKKYPEAGRKPSTERGHGVTDTEHQLKGSF